MDVVIVVIIRCITFGSHVSFDILHLHKQKKWYANRHNDHKISRFRETESPIKCTRNLIFSFDTSHEEVKCHVHWYRNAFGDWFYSMAGHNVDSHYHTDFYHIDFSRFIGCIQDQELTYGTYRSVYEFGENILLHWWKCVKTMLNAITRQK